MGKHRNRNKGRKNRQKKQLAKAQEEKPVEGGPAILQKIRHADPQTRLAALTAILHHHPASSPAFRDMALWQAIREQVMDRNLDVATTAVACLEEFVQKHGRNAADDSSSVDLTTAGWYLILLGRLQESYTQLSSENDKTNEKHDQKWFSLLLACLSSMTALVQENPVVSERLSRTPSLRNDTFTALSQCLSFTVSQKSRGESTLPFVDLQENAAGLWHSIFEDNPDVVQPWFEEQTVVAQSTLEGIWNLIQPRIQNDDMTAEAVSELSELAQLHLVGVILAAFVQLPVLKNKHSESAWSPVLLLQYVKSTVKLPQIDLDESYRTAANDLYIKAQAEAEDSNLESSVVRKQSAKKEPARQIARRLKQQQQKEDAAAAAAALGEEGGDIVMKEKKGKIPEKRTDFDQEWRAMLDGWRRQHVILELALEMTANYTGSIETGEGDDEDDMTMQVEEGPLDDDIRRTLAKLDSLENLLDQIAAHLSLQWPPIIHQHFVDLQEKVGVCIGNILMLLRPGSDDQDAMLQEDEKIAGLFKRLVRAMAHQPAIASTLAVALQVNPRLSQNCVETSDVDMLLGVLGRSDLQGDRKRNLIAVLGLIQCQGDRTPQENRNVCQALMAVGSKDSQLKGDLLAAVESVNVLIDIFAEDDRHPGVFDELHILDHFQKVLPDLKQKLNLLSQSEQEADYMKEVVLNASRFVQYKKGH